MWIEVTGGRLFVSSSGAGSPILMVHGWPLDHRIFEAQVRGLSPEMRVITYDRRAFGRSEARPDLRLEINDIDRILDELDPGSVHLLGMSQGGRIALRYAVSRPDRLRSLILQGAAIDGYDVAGPENEEIPIAEFAALANAGRLDEVKRRWLVHPMMALDECDDECRRLVERIIADYTGADLIEHEPGPGAFPYDVAGALEEFAAPVLLMTGSRETLARRRHAQEIMARAPRCSECILRSSGHLCNLTEPEEYNRSVRRFCKKVDTSFELQPG